MKRDLDLVRKVLLELEADDLSGEMTRGYSHEMVNYHRTLVHEAGLAYGERLGLEGGREAVMLFRLTWAGHEFLDSARDETRWKKVTKSGGDMALEVVKSVLLDLSKDGLKKMLGLS